MSRCCSTSPPTISTGTATWTGTSRPRSASSRGRATARRLIVGIDDAICRDICDELRRAGAARVIPISVTRAGAGRRLCRGRLADRRDRRAARAGSRPRRGRAPAGIAQRAERGGGLCGGARARHRARGRGGGDPLVSRSRAPAGAGRHDRRCALYQRFEGDQRRRDRKGAGLLRRDLLDPRRAAESRRHHLADPVFRARAARLSDRRRDRGVRGDARRCGAVHALRRSGRRARRGARTGAARRGAGGGRAAVAGLRVLRPVPEFRSPRRPRSASLSRDCPRRAPARRS